MNGKGGSFGGDWELKLETLERRRNGSDDGDHSFHFVMPSFSLSLWLLWLNQEQGKHLSWEGKEVLA